MSLAVCLLHLPPRYSRMPFSRYALIPPHAPTHGAARCCRASPHKGRRSQRAAAFHWRCPFSCAAPHRHLRRQEEGLRPACCHTARALLPFRHGLAAHAEDLAAATTCSPDPLCPSASAFLYPHSLCLLDEGGGILYMHFATHAPSPACTWVINKTLCYTTPGFTLTCHSSCCCKLYR